MTIHIQTQATPFGSYTNRSLVSFANLKLALSYSHPAMLTWTTYAAQQSMPLTPGHLLRLWDDAGTDPDGAAYSSSNPLFEGHIQTPKPGSDGHTVEYTAYDPTYRAQNETNVMSTTWPAGTVATDKPVEATGAYPRLVVNATAIQNDDDVAFSRAENQTIADIITLILADQYHPLYWISAAPGDGTSAGNGTAYVSGDLTGMTFEPQEKLVFESESVRSAIDRILQSEPTYRMLWRPGTRKWRFFDITAGTQKTITLNEFDGAYDCLSFEIDRSLEGRFAAVKFYGPERLVPEEFRTDNGTLTVLTTSAVELEVLGTATIKGFTAFQITDTAKRRIGRFLPAEIQVGMGSYFTVPVRSPTLQASWDGGNSWASVAGAYFDFQNGIAFTGGSVPYFYSSAGQLVTTGIQHYFPPTTYRIIAAYFGEAISTRWPVSGFSGTANSVVGLTNEMKLYDEMLAVDYTWYGTPVTTVERLLKFQALAEKLHAERKDIIYAGGLTLDGIVYDFAHLNRRLNIAGVDQDGGSLTTGWEAINAWLTDVEYDFETRLTTLTLSSDQLALMGVDVDQQKKRLRIKALQRRDYFTFNVTAGQVQKYTAFGTPFLHQNVQTQITHQGGYADPTTNVIEEGAFTSVSPVVSSDGGNPK